MRTECTATQMEFQGLGPRKVVASFDGGYLSSDSGALLLRETDLQFDLCQRFAACFTDHRDQRFVEHSVDALIRQRVLGLCLGYEDLNDHDRLSVDPLLATACGNRDPHGQHRRNKPAREAGRALAGHSTLDRLELTPEAVDWSDAKRRYYKLVHHPDRIEQFFVDVFLEQFRHAPAELVLDFDPTDILLHGEQEGRFFHGYYGDYCYLPMYVFCGDHLLATRLRTSKCDASAGTLELFQYLVERIRARFPHTRIIIRGDSAFARNALMDYCETGENLYYLFGLAKNKRLKRAVALQQYEAKQAFLATGQSARVYTEFRYRTLDSWSRARRVIAKAEHLEKGSNPRFIVTSLEGDAQTLYEAVYCARGEMENRIKEQQLYLFADRTSAATMRANQIRLWFASLAYTLLHALRHLALKGTRMARAQCHTIRLKLLKIGARVRLTARRIWVSFTGACPYADLLEIILARLRVLPVLRC